MSLFQHLGWFKGREGEAGGALMSGRHHSDQQGSRVATDRTVTHIGSWEKALIEGIR